MAASKEEVRIAGRANLTWSPPILRSHLRRFTLAKRSQGKCALEGETGCTLAPPILWVINVVKTWLIS